MQLMSVNSGEVRSYPWRGGTESAILKMPISVDVKVTSTGILDDAQADLKHHGGVDKALLVIPASNYERFGLTHYAFGFLGENLTLSGVDETTVRLGDRFQVGSVLLEVTQPRSPCWKLGAIRNDTAFLTEYAESGHVGFYVRVLQEGTLKAGDVVTRIHTDEDASTIQTLFLAKYHQNKRADEWEQLQNAVSHPSLSEAWRHELTRLLETRHDDN